MTTVRDVSLALVLIAAGLALDLVFPRWLAMAAGLGAYVACLVHFARGGRRRTLPPRYFAGEEMNLN